MPVADVIDLSVSLNPVPPDVGAGDLEWAAARADDVANWIPARLTALGVEAVRPRRAAASPGPSAAMRLATRPRNGGVVEAAFAATLDVRLGGTNTCGGLARDAVTALAVGAAISSRRAGRVAARRSTGA